MGRNMVNLAALTPDFVAISFCGMHGVLPRDQVSWIPAKSNLSIDLGCASSTNHTISKVDLTRVE